VVRRPIGIVALADGLKANTSVQQLNASRNQLRTSGMEALAVAIESSSTLRVLDASDNQGDWKDSGSGYDATGMVAFAKAIEASSLTTVNISKNVDQNGQIFGKALAVAITKNNKLVSVCSSRKTMIGTTDHVPA
jgi:hypothetical protein